MKPVFFASLGLVGCVIFSFIGCGGAASQDNDGGNLYACKIDAECGPAEYCYRGHCLPVAVTCNGDGDCPLDEICDLGICKPPCFTKDDCASGEYCASGHCLLGCSQDADCAADETCDQSLHKCRRAECQSDQDCPAGERCSAGTCIEAECSIDQDCPAGERCNFGTCVSVCSGDQDCPLGENCVEGVCVSPLCETDEDCSPGLKCRAGECVECLDDDDCDSSHYCTLNNECLECGDADPDHCGEECLLCEGESPYCLEGTCTECLTQDDCDQSVPRYCTDEGSCQTCDDSSACGPDCVDCTEESLVCSADGSECANCANDEDCGQGARCEDALCVACDTDERCGPECDDCAGQSLHCFGGTTGACSQCAADEHCPGGYWCAAGSCAACQGDDPLHCGADCAVCSFPTAHCVAGACAQCAQDADCNTGYWCENNICASCDTSEHCGPLCRDCLATPATPICSAAGSGCTCQPGSCAEYYECEDSACQFCNSDIKCGADCSPCAGDTPHCLDDGSTSGCVECTNDDQCDSGEWCDPDSNLCAACDLALHCGLACLECDGQTPDCESLEIGCVCNESSCAPFYKCESGSCQFCNTDTECGETCSACGGSTPLCLDEGASSRCVECYVHEDCIDPEYPLCENNTCQPPCISKCVDGTQTAETCASARVVSRADAGDADGADHSGDILEGTNDDQTVCQATKLSSGNEKYYQIYLYAGETLDVTLDVTLNSSYFDGILFLYRSYDACDGRACSTMVLCRDQTINADESFSYLAGEDGWYIIQVDATWQIGQGQYGLAIDLQCNQAGCGC
ncbi:MAG: hypothetical protein JRJ87_05095 [Deltaproteobacteria bacterium]|nr:hypothetical protein [Deltaproteobacteria bacterium]